jgi:hypothetical protein
MWEQPDDVIRSELDAVEKLLWAGRPRLGLMLRPADATMIPFSLMWGGFAIFWESMVVANGAPWFFAIWGVPFILIGLYLIFGRFLVDAWQRGRTYYGISSERIIIVSGLANRRVRSLNVATLSDVTMTEKSDGGGSISFAPTLPGHVSQVASFWPRSNAQYVPCFELSVDVRRVYEIIRAAQRLARQASPT